MRAFKILKRFIDFLLPVAIGSSEVKDSNVLHMHIWMLFEEQNTLHGVGKQFCFAYKCIACVFHQAKEANEFVKKIMRIFKLKGYG